MKLKHYLLSAGTGAALLLILWIFSDAAEGTTLPMTIMAVYLAALMLLSRKLTSWDAMKFSAVSQLVLFVGYKILSVFQVIQDYRQDGFLADYEVSPYQIMDLFFLLWITSVFLMTALIRFALARKKIRQIPGRTMKTIGVFLLVFVLLGMADMLSWKAAKPETEKLNRYCQTFSPEKWQMYAPKRELMLADFLAEYRGISESELEELLGKPEQKEGYFVGYGGQGEMYASFVFEDGLLSDVNFVSLSPFGDNQ